MIRNCLFASAFISSVIASAFAQTSVMLNLQVDGKKRAALLRVPNGVEKPPVVFYVHGATDSGGWFQKMGNTDATADREKYLAVYTCASANCGSGIWEDMQGTSNFRYIFALLDSVDARYKVDRNRIYMTGFSQGGFISFSAACNYSDIFAAVAPISGHVNASATCNLKRPVPIYLTWGAQEGSASFLKDRDYWLKLDKCPATGTMTNPYPASDPDTKRVRVAYGPCEENTAVIMDSIIGHGHYWPRPANGNQADQIWAFLKQYSLNKATDAHPRYSRSRVPITVTYTSGMIRLRGLKDEARVEVTNTKGEVVATARTRLHQIAFQGKSGSVYLVTAYSGSSTAARMIIAP